MNRLNCQHFLLYFFYRYLTLCRVLESLSRASVSHINNTAVLEAVSLDCIEHGCIVGMGVDSYVVGMAQAERHGFFQ